MTADLNHWPKEALRQFAQLLAPLIAEELHATEQRQADSRWAAQDLNTLKKQRTAAMRAEGKRHAA